MYSILIFDPVTKTYSYHKDADDAIFVGTAEETQNELKKLLSKVTLNLLKVVHNTTVTAEFTITDVTATASAPEAVGE